MAACSNLGVNEIDRVSKNDRCPSGFNFQEKEEETGKLLNVCALEIREWRFYTGGIFGKSILATQSGTPRLSIDEGRVGILKGIDSPAIVEVRYIDESTDSIFIDNNKKMINRIEYVDSDRYYDDKNGDGNPDLHHDYIKKSTRIRIGNEWFVLRKIESQDSEFTEINKDGVWKRVNKNVYPYKIE